MSVQMTETDLRDPKAFFEKSWTERYGSMGDHAESVFRYVYDNHGWKYERFGLDRPAFTLRHLPKFLLYSPDYLTATHFVEVKGVGKDSTLKVKCSQLSWLTVWDEQHFAVGVFIWNSYRQQWAEIPVVELQELCYQHARTQMFPEGNLAWFLNLDELPQGTLVWSSIDT